MTTTSAMAPSLPADMLMLICEELGNRQDFGTLFNCALSSKDLSGPALLWLYRFHNSSKLLSTEGTDSDWSKPQYDTFQARRQQQINSISKWALLWKSIIRSSIRKTAYPYALYIRSLDLRNLTELLDDNLFREHAMEDFFADDMAQFLKAQDSPVKKRMRSGKTIGIRIDVPVVLDLVGESITSFVSVSASDNNASVALDDIAPGNIGSLVLLRWTSRLSRLKSMTLWDAAILNQDVANAINNHCPNFNDLTFFRCTGEAIDPDLAAFFGALRVNSLESLTALNAQGIGPETLLSLNNHSKSLKVLKIDGLRPDALKNLSLLQACRALESLALTDAQGFIDLEATENDIYLEVVNWLRSCDQLRDLSFKKIVSAPAILTQLCLNHNTRLRTLDVVGYAVAGNQDFHKALSHQTALESLVLTADPEGAYRDDIDTLVSSVCLLTKLTDLNLVKASDYFKTPEIRRIATSLKGLETFTFSGYDVTDDVWYAISGLHNLRALDFQAVTSFSVNGILSYISTLQPTNQGLNLLVSSQNGDYDLSDNDKLRIQESIMEKVDGRFEFVLFREPESDFDSASE